VVAKHAEHQVSLVLWTSEDARQQVVGTPGLEDEQQPSPAVPVLDESGTLASLSLVHNGSLVMVPARAGVSLNRAVLATQESRT
jgi:hypothetical protein